MLRDRSLREVLHDIDAVGLFDKRSAHDGDPPLVLAGF
jgi:hypothetical protein